MGVFATRSPYRPNPIGLSSVRLVGTEETKDGVVIIVEGADILSGTPIYDIKPYLAFTDSHPDAISGFADAVRNYALEVEIGKELSALIGDEKIDELRSVLSQDPRPSYQDDPDREYGMYFADFEVRFKVANGILRVTEVTKK